MKRPSFQFYPSDWLRDTALRSCSNGARGLWIDMICYMHEGNPYGHLKVGDKVILPSNLARMVGLTIEETEGYLDELKEAGVYDLDIDGTIVSRRMIRDENLRNMRASGGKLGGNPALMDKNKVNLKVIQEVKQKPTPSSSSSSTSSIEILFDKFYQNYPKKIGKPKALQAFKKINPDDQLLNEMLQKLEIQKNSSQWLKDGGEFIPHPSTWLNNRRWEDEVSVPEKKNIFVGAI